MFISEQTEVNLTIEESTWVVDTDVSFHLTPNKECFSSYTAGYHDYVKMGNDGACRIIGIGNVCLLTSMGCCRMLLKDVRHIPDIRLSQTSTGRLDDEGYSGNFRNGTWKFYKGNLIVARARKQNTLNVMYAQVSQNEANIVPGTTVGELWHKRLCHMSQKGMQMLVEKDLMPKMKNMHLDKCVDSLADKKNRAAFRSRALMRRKTVFELVNRDVCYVDARSHSGGQYFVTFIDNYSRKLWAYVLKSNDQVMSVFKEFHAG